MDMTPGDRHARKAIMREKYRRCGDRVYDTDAALLTFWNPSFPRFNGHIAAQQSLEYALALLFSDDRSYGSDDAEEANRILRRILEQQDLRKGSETFGNFIWMSHWSRVKDANAVSFLVSGLVYAYLHFREKLENDTLCALEKAFPHVLSGIRGHRAPWQYSNIFFLNLGGLVSLSRVLEDSSVHAEAESLFDEWLEGASEDGLQEFNSPTYTPVSLFGLESAWANTNSGSFRARVERALDFTAYQLALNMMPSGFQAGAASRAYRNDVLYNRSNSLVYGYVKFGFPLRESEIEDIQERNARPSPMFVNSTLFDYVPPEEVMLLAREKPPAAEVHDRSLNRRTGIASRRTNFVTPSFSIASQVACSVGGHAPPPYVVVARNTGSVRGSIAFLADEYSTRQPCASFLSMQSGAKVLGRLSYELQEENRQRFLDDPCYICEPRVLFGVEKDIEAVRVGNVDWGGGAVRLLPGQPVCLSYGDLFVGLKIEPLDSDRRLLLFWGDDGELRLHLRMYGGPDLRADDEPADLLVFMEAAQAEGGLDEYADMFLEWRLFAEGSGFAAEHPAGGGIKYPYSPKNPDPLGDCLHVSPGRVIRPGDLLNIVNAAEEAR